MNAKLWTLKVHCNANLIGEQRAKHAKIFIEPTISPDDPGDVDLPEILPAYRHLAGVMTRAAMLLVPEHLEMALEHKLCHGWDCWLMFDDATIENAQEHGTPPNVCITVPQELAEEWLAKVRASVAAVLEADATAPTAEQVAAWDWDGTDGTPAPKYTLAVVKNLNDNTNTAQKEGQK